MKYLWLLLTFGLGILTLVAVFAFIQMLVNIGSEVSGSPFPVVSGFLFVVIPLAFLAASAFGTRACARQAARYHQPAPPRSGADRRPWER